MCVCVVDGYRLIYAQLPPPSLLNESPHSTSPLTCWLLPLALTVASERGVSVHREGGKDASVRRSLASVRGFCSTMVAPAAMHVASTDELPVSTTMGPP